ncbi:MAG: Rrf2 family transcriptional regulator [Candidatus Omnitrophota bacterium]|jgi:Rrf2 family protein|nr:MAG: Rrf2 family transcriptional regulator [Candidatus Omnitrophota bacterium]
MKLITRDTDYAIRALCYIMKVSHKVVSSAEMVSKLHIPRPFLRKILQVLNKKGVLKSTKGLGGGFEVSVPPENIFLVDLIEIFQGPLRLNECLLKNMLCPHKKNCCLKKKIDAIERYVISQLRSIRIADLLQTKGGRHGKKKDNQN